jgi:hypothetical protein
MKRIRAVDFSVPDLQYRVKKEDALSDHASSAETHPMPYWGHVCVFPDSPVTMSWAAGLGPRRIFDRAIANGRSASVCVASLEMPKATMHHLNT